MAETPSFVSLSKDCYVYKPQLERIKPSETDPNVILIFGWMDAQLPHLHKYTKIYSELYPAATQILVQSRQVFWISSERTNFNRLTPVAELLTSMGIHQPQSPNSPRILVHSFSNGGAWQFLTLAKHLKPQPPLTSAIIIDSCPGFGTIYTAMDVFTATVRNRYARVLAKILVWMFFQFQFIFIGARMRRWIAAYKANLLLPSILPWMNKSTPRLYIYSKSDLAVPAAEVEEHLQQAKSAGLNVHTEIYDNSPHVAHARSDPTRYWAAVKQLWQSVTVVNEQAEL